MRAACSSSLPRGCSDRNGLLEPGRDDWHRACTTLEWTMACSRYIALAFALCGCAQIAGLDDDDSARALDTNGGIISPTDRCAMLDPGVTSLELGEVKVRGTMTGTMSFTVRNEGGSSITVTPVIYGADADVFHVAGVPTFELLPKTQRLVQVSFTPTKLGRASATLDFAAGASCKRPMTVALTGTGSDESVLVSPPSVDFGDVACGSSPSPRLLNVTSELSDASQLSLSTGKGLFVLDRWTVAVAPNSVTPVSIQPGSVPKASLALVTDVITAKLGGITRTIDVRMQPKGVSLTFDPKAVDVEVGSTKTVTVTNVGNARGTVHIELPNKFSLTGGSTFDLDAGAARMFAVSYYGTGSTTQTVDVRVNDAALCKKDTLTLSGKVPSGGSSSGSSSSGGPPGGGSSGGGWD